MDNVIMSENQDLNFQLETFNFPTCPTFLIYTLRFEKLDPRDPNPSIINS